MKITLTRPSAGAQSLAQSRVCEVLTAADAVAMMEAQTGTALLRDSTALRTGVTLFLNGRDVRYCGGLGKPLQEEDEIRIVAPITDT